MIFGFQSILRKSWITRDLHWLEVLRSSSSDTRYGCVSKLGTLQICLKWLVLVGNSWISDLPILKHIHIFRRHLGSIFWKRILTPTPPEHTLEAAAPTSTVRSSWGSNLWEIHPSFAMKRGRWGDWNEVFQSWVPSHHLSVRVSGFYFAMTKVSEGGNHFWCLEITMNPAMKKTVATIYLDSHQNVPTFTPTWRNFNMWDKYLTVGYIHIPSFQILLKEHSRRIKRKKTRDLVTRPNDS